MSGTILIHQLGLYLLVFCRMAGMILFNPVFGQRMIPAQVRMGLTLGLSLLLAPAVGARAADAAVTLPGLALEFAVGYGCGFVFQCFYYLLFAVGDFIDTGFGLSMAKVFDPGTNIQTSLSGRLLQAVFVLYLFATDSHLIFLKLLASSYDLVPLGAAALGPELWKFLADVFVSTFSLAMQLAMPFIAAAFTLELAMGVLMKLVPQISVFVIHFQMKILLGIALLFLYAGPVSGFVQNYLTVMFETIQKALLAA